MKKILFIIILIGFCFAQSNFSFVHKPPVEVKQVDIILKNVVEPVLDEFGVETGVETIQVAQYRVYLYDEDGKRVYTSIDSGNLLPYLTNAQALALKDVLDAVVVKAQSLVE